MAYHVRTLINNELTQVRENSKIQKFVSDLNTLDLELDRPGVSIQDSFTEFYNKFKKSYDENFLSSTNRYSFDSRKHNLLRKEWITIGLAKSCRTRSYLYKLWKQDESENKDKTWITYKEYSRKLDVLLSKAAYQYYNKKFSDHQSDLKKTWQLINNLLGRKRHNRLTIFKDDQASHSFNKYFVSIAQDLIRKTYSDSTAHDMNDIDTSYNKYMKMRSEDDPKLDQFEVTKMDIDHFISKLNNGKSTYFAPRILKLASATLSPLLAKLYNRCLEVGYFPKELKIAKVIPLYKNKGSISEMKNYRPISMLSVFSKIFEKIIHREITKFFEDNKILNDCQYGFRKSHSTFHALINATENVYRSIDNKEHTLGIFVDFSRAFDTIDHRILLDKLLKYGISGNLHLLLTDYLTDRKQFVYYGGIESSLLTICCGVPQGSVLGPLLFILFVNDIVNISELAKFILFADDLNMFLSSTCRDTLYRYANDILKKLYEYCSANRLIINYEKCCFMEFKAKSNEIDLPLCIGNNAIKKATQCKFLGVILNSNLSWNDHISHVKTQVSKSCGSLFSIRHKVPYRILRTIYMAIVQPYLIYCISLWATEHQSKNIKQLFILQKKCLRIVCNKTDKIGYAFQHTKPMFAKTRIMTLFSLFYYITAIEGAKLVKSGRPRAIYYYFEISARTKRFILPKTRLTEIQSKSFIYNTKKILNYAMNHDMKYDELSVNTLKLRLKRHLLYIQNISVNGEATWLPCNHDIFSCITVG